MAKGDHGWIPNTYFVLALREWIDWNVFQTEGKSLWKTRCVVTLDGGMMECISS